MIKKGKRRNLKCIPISLFCAGLVALFSGCGPTPLLKLPIETVFEYDSPDDEFSRLMVIDRDTLEVYRSHLTRNWSMGRYLIKPLSDDLFVLRELEHSWDVTESVRIDYLPQKSKCDTIRVKVIFNADLNQDWHKEYYTLEYIALDGGVSRVLQNLEFRRNETDEISKELSNYYFDFAIPASQDSIVLTAHRHLIQRFMPDDRQRVFELGRFYLRPGYDIAITYPNFNRDRTWYAFADGEILRYHKGKIFWRGRCYNKTSSDKWLPIPFHVSMYSRDTCMLWYPATPYFERAKLDFEEHNQK